MSKPPDYGQLEADARSALGDPVARLQGLTQVWTMFMAAHEVGTALRDDFTKLSLWAKYAMTRTMVVDYAKPWSANRLPSIVNLNKTFLQRVTSQPLHADLKAFRDKVAAHLDAQIQPDGVGLIGAETANDVPNPNRFTNAFMPGRVRVDVSMPMALDDLTDVTEIVDHIEVARDATWAEVRLTAAHVRDTALKYPAVLDRLSGLVEFHAVTPDARGNVDMPPQASTPNPITSPSPVSTIGSRKFVSFMTVVEVVPDVEFEESGDGFTMKAVLQPNGTSVNYTFGFYDCQ